MDHWFSQGEYSTRYVRDCVGHSHIVNWSPFICIEGESTHAFLTGARYNRLERLVRSIYVLPACNILNYGATCLCLTI